jgi:hypothetical protein
VAQVVLMPQKVLALRCHPETEQRMPRHGLLRCMQSAHPQRIKGRQHGVMHVDIHLRFHGLP